MSTGPDIITVEVVRNNLISIAEEMKRTIIRTAMSPIIYEVLDFSTGVFDRRARLVAQASGLAIFLGTLDWAVQATLDKFGSDLKPGDVILSNDPYRGGGTHLNDVAMVVPVFHEEELAGFVGVRAHWLDVGGKVAFSQMTDASEIYQEGLQFPIIKVCDGGVMNETLLETIRANVREPDFVVGDMRAQIAACTIGGNRLRGLLDRYGVDTVQQSIDRVISDAEVITRDALRAIPDGTYRAEDRLEDDGNSGPARIAVVITKQGTDITFDFSESDPATRSSYNTGLCGLVSAARVMLKAVTAPHIPANDGCFRPLKVIAKEGTLVHAQPPTPVCMYGELAGRVADTIWRALAPAVPDLLPAGHYGTVCAQGLAGWDTRHDPPVYAMHGGPNAGGWGAGPEQDGESCLICMLNGDTRNTPVEIIEAKNPLIVTRYELRAGSGGAGRTRGGLGTTIEYEVTTDGDYVGVFIAERCVTPPFGLNGGQPGATNNIYVTRGDEVIPRLFKATGVRLQHGDLVTVEAGGGGGYGDPGERDPARVADDVKQGYVSASDAEAVYGVSVDPRTCRVDADGTGRLRGDRA